MYKFRLPTLILLAVMVSIGLVACGGVETQVVTEVVEVTRMVEGETTTEFVEVTRIVEVEAPEPTEEQPTEEPAPSGPKTVTYGDLFWVDRGWAIETDDAFAMSRWGILEPLIKVDFDGNMVPNLAESWEQTDENTWEITLRSDVTFQNGEPFNAEAVVTALTFLSNVETPPRGFNPSNIVSIEAAGEFTVVITTAEPDVLIPNRLTSPNTGILAPSAYASGTTVDAFGTGTGPFILVDEVPDQSVTLERNDNYWGGAVNLEGATVLWVPDGSVRATMIQTGEVDIARYIPIPQVPLVESNPDVTLFQIQEPRTRTLYMNNSSGPLADVLLRQAVLHAIDKQAIVDAILEGVDSPAASAFAPTEGWFNTDLSPATYDPDLARELLGEAGYEEGELTLRIWTYPSRVELPPISVAIQEMLSDIGINSEVRVAQYSALEGDVLGGNYDIFVLSRGHLLDNYDPEGFLSADYSCTGSYNLSQFCNDQVDALLAEARSTADSEARFEMYRQIQAILDEDAVDVFLNHSVILDGISNRVINFRPHLLGHYVLTADLDVSG